MDSKPPPSDSMSFILLLIAAVCLIVLSMLFSVAESSFLSMNRLRLRFLISRKDRRALRAGKLLDKKETMLNTLLVANELVNILLSALLTATALRLFGPAGVGIATITVTVLLLVFGEITPKTVSTRHPDAIAYALSWFVQCVFVILHPLILIITFFSRCVLALFGIHVKKSDKSFTEDEIKTIIDVGGEEGVLEKSERTMMRRVFKFTDLEAQDIMVPRTMIIAVSYTATYRSILELAQRTNFSRFPVYRKDVDDIIGILYVKDLLSYKGLQKEFSIRNFMRPPLFILGTKKMSSVQQMLNENRQTLAVVIDEYSGTDGILTKEDISREIFGPIAKEYSMSGRTTAAHIRNPDNATVDGTVRLIDLQEILRIKMESSLNETIGGWITEKLDHLPETGESVEYSGYRFTVSAVEKWHVEEVHIEKTGRELERDL